MTTNKIDYSSNNATLFFKKTGIKIPVNNYFLDRMGSSAEDILAIFYDSKTFEEFYAQMPYQNEEMEELSLECWDDIKRSLESDEYAETSEWAIAQRKLAEQ